MFAEKRKIAALLHWRCRPQLQPKAVFLHFALSALMLPSASAQSSALQPASPIHWLASKAGPNGVSPSDSQASKDERFLLKLHGDPNQDIDQVSRLALKVVNTDDVARIDEEIVGHYGDPTVLSETKKVWEIEHSSGDTASIFAMAFISLPGGEVVITVEKQRTKGSETDEADEVL